MYKFRINERAQRDFLRMYVAVTVSNRDAHMYNPTHPLCQHLKQMKVRYANSHTMCALLAPTPLCAYPLVRMGELQLSFEDCATECVQAGDERVAPDVSAGLDGFTTAPLAPDASIGADDFATAPLAPESDVDWWTSARRQLGSDDDISVREIVKAMYILEVIYTLVHQLGASTNKADIFHAVTQALRAITGVSLIKSITRIIAVVVHEILDALAELSIERELAIPSIPTHSMVTHVRWQKQSRPLMEAELQSDPVNPFRKMRHMFDHIETYNDHPFVVRAKRIFRYALVHGLVERMGITIDKTLYSKAEVEAMKLTHSSKAGFYWELMESTTLVLERLHDCHTSGKWSPLFHSGKSYGAWADAVFKLKEQAQMLHNPDAVGFSYHDFLGRLDETIEQGDVIVKYGDLSKADLTVVKRHMSDLRIIKGGECTKKVARQQRETPFSVLYAGGSSIGKSSLMHATFVHFAKVHGLPSTPEYQYTRSFSDEYWSGFSSSMWSIVLDDVAAKLPQLNDDPSIDEIIQIVNQVPYCPPQADLADKGKTPLRPLLVQASTNTIDLHAFSYYSNELAIRRRFPLVLEVFVKREYATVPEAPEGERMLDTTKCAGHVGYPNFWIIKMKRVVAVIKSDKQRAELIDVETFDDINKLLMELAKRSKAHFENQKQVSTSLAALQEIEICPKCFGVTCACEQIQSVAHVVAVVSICALIGCMWLWLLRSCRQARAAIEQVCVRTTEVCVDTAMARVSARLGPNPMQACATQAVRSVVGRAREAFFGAPAPVLPDEEVDTSRGIPTVRTLRTEAQRFRERMLAAGNAARKKRLPGWLIALAAALPLVSAYLMYMRRDTPAEEQGASAKIGERPVAQDEKESPWVKSDFQPSRFVSRKTVSWKGLPREQIMAKIARNVFYTEIDYEKGGTRMRRPAHIVALGGHVYMTNAHNFEEGVDVFDMRVVVRSETQGVGENFKHRQYADAMWRLEDRDIVFFTINNTTQREDIRELFANSEYRQQCEGYLLSRAANGEVYSNNLTAISYIGGFGLKNDVREYESWRAVCARDTEKGQCGSLMIATTQQGPVILGMHRTGGNANRCTSVFVTTEVIHEAYTRLRSRVVRPSAPALETPELQAAEILPLHHKSVFNYIPEGTAEVFGSLTGFRGAHKSKVQPTALSDQFVAEGYARDTGAPVMSGWKPWRKGALDIVQQEFVANQAILDECVESFANDIISGLSTKDLSELKPLDDGTTLNGFPGTRFIDKMNRRTSMGYPWKAQKNKFLKYVGEHDVWQDYVEFDDKFYERVDGIIDEYTAGQRHCPVFCGHLKDEPTKQAKIDEAKTRVFCAAPADWSFVVRKFLLPYVRVTQNNRFLFECAPGTNPMSPEWDEIYHYMTQHGVDRLIAGDYGKFDKKMCAMFILAAFEIIRAVHKAAGWPDEWLRIIDGIAADTAFSFVDFNGDVVMFYGSNPSGHPLTVIINSLVNSLYVRYCWKVSGHDLKEFKRLVALMVYGDDNMMNVAREVVNFDHTVLVDILATIGVEYTMADKTSASVPFVHIRDVAFLKRTFRFDVEIGHHVAPLDEGSIAKMLTMCIPSDAMSLKAQMVVVVETALFEYFAYGREVYDQKRAMFWRVLSDADMLGYLEKGGARAHLATFDEQLAYYKGVCESYPTYTTGECERCLA